MRKYAALALSIMLLLTGCSMKDEAINTSEGSSVDQIIQEKPSEAEVESSTITVVSADNIYDNADKVFEVEGVEIVIGDELEGATHSVLNYEDGKVEVPVSVNINGMNSVLALIRFEPEQIDGLEPAYKTGTHFIYIDFYENPEYGVIGEDSIVIQEVGNAEQ